jgi:hypothetical protein
MLVIKLKFMNAGKPVVPYSYTETVSMQAGSKELTREYA